jgi:hypothetical protein
MKSFHRQHRQAILSVLSKPSHAIIATYFPSPLPKFYPGKDRARLLRGRPRM